MQSIIIADSHNLCREALCDYIRHADKDYSIDGFSDYQSLIDHMRKQNPDLVLIDMDFPGMDQEGAISEFLKGRDTVKLGMMVPLNYSPSTLESRIQGVFPKSLSCKAFMNGINDLLDGKTFFPAIPNTPFHGQGAAKCGPQTLNLTSREKEVLTYLVKGASNKDIARALDLQVVTIKLHVRGICRKMKASNRTQAALIAKENGWG